MTQQEQEGYRQQLKALRDRLAGDVSMLEEEGFKAGGEASGNLSNVPMHMADLGTETYEEEVTLGLLENQEQILEEIAAAWQRLDQGTFGRCEECAQEVTRARLQALPYTRFCVACARKAEEGTRPGIPD